MIEGRTILWSKITKKEQQKKNKTQIEKTVFAKSGRHSSMNKTCSSFQQQFSRNSIAQANKGALLPWSGGAMALPAE